MKPGEALASTCAERAGSGAFREAMAAWERYAAIVLEIRTRAQLTRAGVDAASASKQLALRQLTAHFTRAIASGAPEWIAAGTYQTGLAQWYYGMFLRDVQLPPDLTEAQRDAARRGSAQQAQAYFDLALKTWTALVAKAATDKFENEWVSRARAALGGEGIPPREVVR